MRLLKFKQKLAKTLLLLLFCSPFVFAQPYSFINYKGVIYKVEAQTVCFTVKDGYYNDELL